MNQAAELVKLRYRYTKQGKVRFVGHRDLCGAWERVLRRARVPLSYSEGFNVRPRLSFGYALPVGSNSRAEYLDALLVADVSQSVLDSLLDGALRAELEEAMPDGVEISGAGLVHRQRSLQNEVTSSDWEFSLATPDTGAVAERVAAIWAASSWPVEAERKGIRKKEDIRPSILSMQDRGMSSDGRCLVVAELATAAGAGGKSIRPSEVAAALAPGSSYRLCRIEQWINCDDQRRDPLEGSKASRSAPLTERCA